MKWVTLFLVINANVLAGAAVYRIFTPPSDNTDLALHRDHIILEQHQIVIFKQLKTCLLHRI